MAAAANKNPEARRASRPSNAGGRPVDFRRIETEGKSTHELVVELGQALNAAHECVHQQGEKLDAFTAYQKGVNDYASEQRHITNNELQCLQGDIRDVKREVVLVKDQQATDGARITSLAVKLGLVPAANGEKASIAAWGPGRAAAAGFTVLSGVVLAYKILEPVLEPGLRALHHSIMSVH